MPLTSKLLSVNVAMPRTVTHRGREVSTGIFKEPLTGRVAVGPLGLAGDGQADRSVHGGIHKAVYAYSWANTLHWRTALARNDLAYGSFGENLSVEDMPEDRVHIGDVFRVGDAVLQVTQPREPCFKLNLRVGAPHFARTFLKSGRVGFYLKVIEGGELAAGDDIELLRPDPETLSIREINELRHFDKQNVEGARRALAIEALSPAWREPFAARLARGSS